MSKGIRLMTALAVSIVIFLSIYNFDALAGLIFATLTLSFICVVVVAIAWIVIQVAKSLK